MQPRPPHEEHACRSETGEEPTTAAVQSPQSNVVAPDAEPAEHQQRAADCRQSIRQLAQKRWTLDRAFAPDRGGEPRDQPRETDVFSGVLWCHAKARNTIVVMSYDERLRIVAATEKDTAVILH